MPDVSIEDSIQDFVLDILKELGCDSPPKPRVRRTMLKVEPGKSVGINTTSESDDSDENNIDEPEELIENVEINNVEIVNDIESIENQASSGSNKSADEEEYGNSAIVVEINQKIKVIKNVNKIEECEIKVNDWLSVMYHTNIYVCKVIKIGDFEGLFMRKNPTLKRILVLLILFIQTYQMNLSSYIHKCLVNWNLPKY